MTYPQNPSFASFPPVVNFLIDFVRQAISGCDPLPVERELLGESHPITEEPKHGFSIVSHCHAELTHLRSR
jgi:hypothetical protein